jgi:tRNA(Ile)-lysidine synthase
MNMEDLYTRFQDFIQHKTLFSKKDKILVAISGGLDSVVLTDLLSQLSQVWELDIMLAHCNFHLRGAESDGDEAFVMSLAQSYGINCFVQHFDTQTLAKENSTSIQITARTLRYAWFEQLRQAHSFDYIATAHHHNDSLETVLLNLTRGTGMAGLRGIPVKNNHIIRPLLFATREEIEQYAQNKQIQWREDSSNQQNKYYRNLIRNEVIPLLKKINPNLEHTFAQTLERTQAVEHIFLDQVAIFKQKHLTQKQQEVWIDLAGLQNNPPTLNILHQILQDYGFQYLQSKDILATLHKESGKQFTSHTHLLVKDRTAFIISPLNFSTPKKHTIEADTQILETEDFHFTFSQIADLTHFEIPKNPQMACLDFDALQFPLSIRTWQEGDYFYPLGMNHQQKISDFFINQKIPLSQKARIPLLCSGNDIVWVIGYRLDNRFKISQDTKKVFLVQHLA